MTIERDNAMGERRIVDKTIRPLSSVTNLTPASFTVPATNIPAYGAMVMGNYKNGLAFMDLDKIGNQPLVDAEQKYILGILDGREEGYDLRTITVPVTAVAGTPLSGSLIVPAAELWNINAIQLACPGDVTAGFTLNWHCSFWTDRAVVPSAFGQPFRTAAVALASVGIFTHIAPAGLAIVQLDEFGPIATAWLITNKVPLLRLPALTTITFTVLTDTALPTLATACTLSLFGSRARILVA